MIPGSYQYGGINFCFKFDAKTWVEVSSEDGGAVRSTYTLSQSDVPVSVRPRLVE